MLLENDDYLYFPVPDFYFYLNYKPYCSVDYNFEDSLEQFRNPNLVVVVTTK